MRALEQKSDTIVFREMTINQKRRNVVHDFFSQGPTHQSASISTQKVKND
jgi:hypothetical protein